MAGLTSMESGGKLQLCLTWNSFTENIVSSLETSYGDQDFVDVTLACEGESIMAHKLVLSACSLYLKRLLKENPCPHPVIILRGVGMAELRDLLTYMYHGEVRVEQDRIAKLLYTAELLEVTGLRDISHHRQKVLTHEPDVSECTTITSNDLHCQPEHHSETDPAQVPPPIKRSRPVPGLQCIQRQYNRTDNREETCHSTGTLPFQPTITKEVSSQVKLEIDDTDMDYRDTGADESSSEGETRNGFTRGMFAAEMLRQVASRASNSELSLDPLPLSSMLFTPGSVDPEPPGANQRKLAFHEPRPCPLCQKVYRDAATLRTHTTIMHTPGNELFTCTCGTQFRTKFDMYTHRKNGHK